MVTWFNKWLLLVLVPLFSFNSPAVNDAVHPLHVSVTEVNHNTTDKTLEISCKLFTDDFEKILGLTYKTKVDLINPADRPAMEKLVNDYIHKHLQIKVDGKPVAFNFIGYEKDNDAIYSYYQVDNISSMKQLGLVNNILHEMFTDQINLIHTTVAGANRKSTKLNYPDKEASFSY